MPLDSKGATAGARGGFLATGPTGSAAEGPRLHPARGLQCSGSRDGILTTSDVIERRQFWEGQISGAPTNMPPDFAGRTTSMIFFAESISDDARVQGLAPEAR